MSNQSRPKFGYNVQRVPVKRLRPPGQSVAAAARMPKASPRGCVTHCDAFVKLPRRPGELHKIEYISGTKSR